MSGESEIWKVASKPPERCHNLLPSHGEHQQFASDHGQKASSKNESDLTHLDVPALPGFHQHSVHIDAQGNSSLFQKYSTPVSENEGVDVRIKLQTDKPGPVTVSLMSPDAPYAPVFSEQVQVSPTQGGETFVFHGIAAQSSDGLMVGVKASSANGKMSVHNLSVNESTPLTAGNAHFKMQGNEVVEQQNGDVIQRDAHGKEISMRNGKPFLIGFEIQSIKPGDNSQAQQALQSFVEGNANAVTITPYWTQFEDPTKREGFAEQAKWAQEHDMQIKEHPAFWTHLVPPNVTPDDIKAHAQEIARLPGQFTEINEVADGASAPANGVTELINKIGPAKATEEAIDWIRQADPKKTIIYNDFQNGEQEMKMLDQLQKDGKLPDAIGIQLHMDQGNWPLDRVENTVNELAKYGKPVYITEISVLSGAYGESVSKVNHDAIQSLEKEIKSLSASGANGSADKNALKSLDVSAQSLVEQSFKGEDVGVIASMSKVANTIEDPALKAKILSDLNKATDWASTPEGEKRQADYTVNLYKLLHSNPHVQGITYWDLSDKNSWKHAPRGWFREDGSPKPVVAAMEKLFGQWRAEEK